MIIHIIIKEEIKVGVSKSEKEMVEGLIVDYIWNKYKYKCTKREIRGVSWYILDINLLSNDRVELKEVLDKDGDGRLVIPRFITDIGSYRPLGGCRYTEVYVDNSGLNEGFDASFLCAEMESIRLKVVFKHGERVKRMANMFYDCNNLKYIDISCIDTSNVEDMSGLFRNCSLLEEIDFGNINTSKVKNMSSMFYHCNTITELNISNFDTSNVEDMESMFNGCFKLSKIDTSKLHTSKVKSMEYMFYDCRELSELDLRRFNTEKVNNMKNMFNGCSSLKHIDLSNFKTSNVTNMESMFNGCKELEELDLNSLDTNKVQSICYIIV